jgi:hypothetical protein
VNKVLVPQDQALSLTQARFTMVPTPTPATLTVGPQPAGAQFILFFTAEVARGSAGGGDFIMGRVITVTGGAPPIHAHFRRRQGLENAPAGGMATDSPPGTGAFAVAGDIIPWSGAVFLENLSTGSNTTFQMQYGSANAGTGNDDAIRVRNQRLMLVRVA